MSPLLFILVIEIPIRELHKTMEGGLLAGLKVRGLMEILKLLFANDTILFCDADAIPE